jgi:hypothetical protein
MNMIPCALWVVALWLVPSPAARRDIPAELRMANQAAVWVAADVAIDAEDRIREDRLHVHAPFVKGIAAIEAKEAALAGETPVGTSHRCASFVDANAEIAAMRRSPEDLIDHTVTSMRGQIVAVRQGFYHGRPGSLLRLAGRYLRGAAASETYLFYPAATITTSEGMVCSTPGSRYGVPQVGDEVIVLDPSPLPRRFGDSAVLWVHVTEHLVYIPRGRRPILPDPLLSLSAADDPVAAIVRLIAAGSGGVVAGCPSCRVA